MFKRSVISRKLKAALIALAIGLVAKTGVDVVPAEVESFIVWAAAAISGWAVRESEEFIEERIGRDDLVV